jgi:hypothetical protein
MSQKKVGDKTVSCLHSGLMSDLSDCGSRADWYAYIFVGRISVITPAKDDESEVQIVPEEVFSGSPETPVTVITSQGLCFPKLAVGDRWLFYLRKVKDKPIVLDYYGNDSRPVADAQREIETFRTLRTIGDFGLLRGEVVRGNSFGGKAVPYTQVFATRQSDSTRFASSTDSEGRYEFQPLPPGKYEVTVGPIGSHQPDDSEFELAGGGCWDLTLSRSPHAHIGGSVRRSDGTPLVKADVVLIGADGTWYLTTQTDAKGHYEFDSLEPGKFMIGLNFPARVDWFNGSGGGPGVTLPPASLFYSGATRRSEARVIELHTDEKLDSFNFTLPLR